MSQFEIRRSSGPSAEFHHRATPEDPAAIEVWIQQPDRPALVLGSSQPDELVDAAAAAGAGWEVCRRRSGGGLVAVVPDHLVWIDVVVGRGHRVWDDDVNRAFDWLGRVWRDTLHRLGHEATVHTGPLQDREIGALWCFGGLGAGELAGPGRDRRKLVGMSQRRSRGTARFQTMLALTSDIDQVVPLVRDPLRALLVEGDVRSMGLEPSLEAPRHDVVVDTFLEVLDGFLRTDVDAIPKT